MEERGIISGYQGSKPREVLVTKDRWQELKMATTPVPAEAKTTEVGTAINTIKKISELNGTEEEY